MGMAVEEALTSLTTSFGACHSADQQNMIAVTFVYKIYQKEDSSKKTWIQLSKMEIKISLKL